MSRDVVKTLRTQAQLYRQMKNAAQAGVLERTADEVEALRAELAALKEAVRLLIITTQPVLGEDGHLWTTEHAVDALAALVGEDGR